MYLIYGGNGAIGGAIAHTLSARGQACHLVGRNARALAGTARALGANATFTAGDVTNPDVLEAATTAAAGPLKGLIYAVGNIRLKPMHRLSAGEVEEDFALNALGALRAVQAARGALVQGEGAVLLFSTVAVAQGFPNHASIAMAKGAVEGLVRSLAAELAPKVRVNAIAPSLTAGGMGDALAGSAKLAEAIAKAHPLRRLGRGDDMASLAAALLEPGGWITGQVIHIDGGRGALRISD